MATLFTTGATAVLFAIAIIAWWLSEFIGSTIIPKFRARGRTSVRRDRGSAVVIITGVYLAVFIALGFGYNAIAPLPDLAYYAGVPLIFLGILVRQWAIAVLGRFFSLSVRVTEDHRVVDNGPYRYVRHPSYTGALLTFVGIGLGVQSWAAVLVLLIMFVFVYGYRMMVEEKMLRSELGQAYVSYMQRTKRIIPFII